MTGWETFPVVETGRRNPGSFGKILRTLYPLLYWRLWDILAIPLAGRLRLPHETERERETNDMEKNNRNKKGRDLRKNARPPFLFISWRSKAKSNKNHSGRMEKLMEKKGRRGQSVFTLFSPPGMEQPKAIPTALLAQVNKVLQVLKVGLGKNVFCIIWYFPQQMFFCFSSMLVF